MSGRPKGIGVCCGPADWGDYEGFPWTQWLVRSSGYLITRGVLKAAGTASAYKGFRT